MIDSKDINDYIQLSRLIGGFSELVQGSGGNISVKNDTHICIKSSGRILAETDLNYAYSICSIKKLQELFQKNDENTKSSVEDGESNSVPSMEVFFHLLPHKWIVHIHPTFLLKYLCSEGWRNIHSNYNSMFVPYKTPGLELSNYIHQNYHGESVLFLQNHGLIVCGTSPKEICEIVDSIYTENVSIIQNNYQHLHLTNVYDLLAEIQLKTNTIPVIKNTYKNPIFYDRLFFSLTPDIVLFLKKYPLVKEDSSEKLSYLFDKYYNHHKYIPSILKIQDRVYILGKNFKHCLAIEEIFYSYLEIVSSIRTKDLHTLYDDNVFALQNSEKEVHRMNIL